MGRTHDIDCERCGMRHSGFDECHNRLKGEAMTPDDEAWEELVKEADPCTAAGCGCGRLIHGHYRIEKEIAWRKAILAADAELKELRAQLCRAKEGK